VVTAWRSRGPQRAMSPFEACGGGAPAPG
jgi:hypothetical protein